MSSQKPSESKKKQVLGEIFDACLRQGNMEFDSARLKNVSSRYDFQNQSDAVKIDRSDLLPEIMKQHDYYHVHLGKGRYRFVKGISSGFHGFEAIPDDCRTSWPYRKSLLNDIDDSESSALSIINNQRILHDFLYQDIVASPKMYNARRTRRDVEYMLGSQKINANKLQLEMDMVCEYMGYVTIFEAKNGFSKDFAIYQLFHPYLYFMEIAKSRKLIIDLLRGAESKQAGPGLPQAIKGVDLCYMLRGKGKDFRTIRLYLYGFGGEDPTSIGLKKCAQYELQER